MRTYFERELEELHNELIKMGGMVEQAITRSIEALEPGKREQARQVAQGDKIIDDMEQDIESRCLRLMLRQQPVARDLRAISTAIKMVTDMERIGDQAADIADIVLRYDGEISGISQHIPAMADAAVGMVSDSIRSFVQNDLALAQEVIARDDVVDGYFAQVKEELIACLKSESSDADRALDAMMIAKYLERIGDHAVNICEWVEFGDTGVHKSAKIL